MPNNQKNIEKDSTKKSWSSRYKTSGTILNDKTNQKELLVVRNKEWYEKLCPRIFQVLTEQDAIYEKGRRITSLRNARRINIDIIKLLSRSNKKDAIMVIIDWFTKIIWLRVTITNISSEETVKIYWDKIWKLHEIP